MLLASLTKDLMMESRYREAVDAAKVALEVAQAAGDEISQIRALDAMGVSLFGLARFDEGERSLREAMRRSEEGGHLHMLQSHLNLAESLAEAGRLAEAREIADEGFAKLSERGYPRRWLALMRSELAFEAGDWAAAERLLPSPGRPTMGMTFVNEALRRIELALGRGDHETARTLLDQAADVAAESREPQWIGPLGALRAELERRGGDLDAARTAIEDALDRLDFCSQDVARMSRVAAAGVRVEADAAVRARDLGEDPSFAIAMAEGLIARVHACAEGERPVEAAFLASARAEQARAEDRDDPDLWTAAVGAWEALGRPYRAAQAKRRKAEALLAAAIARAATARAGGAGGGAGDRRRMARVRDRGLRAARAAAAGAGRAFAGARANRHGRRRRPVRPHAARTSGAVSAGRRADEPRDRPGAVHGGEDGERPCLPDPLQARRAIPHGGRGSRPPRGLGLGVKALDGANGFGAASRAQVDREKRGGDQWFPHIRQCAGTPERCTWTGVQSRFDTAYRVGSWRRTTSRRTASTSRGTRGTSRC